MPFLTLVHFIINMRGVNLSVKNSGGRSFHKHMVRLGIPADIQIAAQQVDGHLTVSQIIQNGRHSRRTGTGTAGQRLAGAPLPHAHFQRFPVNNTDKLGIDPVREPGMAFKNRPDLRQIQ